MAVEERFLKYVGFDTQSDPNSVTTPSTKKQLKLAEALKEEMLQMGIADAHVDEFGIVYGSIPSNVDKKTDTIGFIAHMDTSPDLTGENVKPRIIKDYDGKDIILNEELNIVMSPKDFPTLLKNIHDDLIVTDGTTLLGGDDKAGVAEIMEMAETIIKENLPHGDIKIAFTPDEEVGRGADNFNIAEFAADYAYTVDGGDVESVDYENFNAAAANITVHGLSIHPGTAKGKMINSLLVAMEFQQMLPVQENPAYTEGYEGFQHITSMEGYCEETKMEYIIRNHNKELFEKQKENFHRIAAYLNQKYGEHTIDLKITDSYANMREIIEKNMLIVDQVKQALRELGLEPTSQAIRGGTDGARLTYDGLPCPNIGTGGYNYHGKYEYVSINSMHICVKLLLKIIENSVK